MHIHLILYSLVLNLVVSESIEAIFFSLFLSTSLDFFKSHSKLLILSAKKQISL